MRKITGIAAIVILSTASAFAHGGHVHRLLGTVKSLSGTTLVVKTTESKEVAVSLTAATQVTRDGKPAQKNSLKTGVRVAVRLSDDGRTAAVIKIAK